jgi:hypothetical protein
LFDECVPRPLLRDLTGHDAHHVVDMGWSSKRNGELLELMLAERFEALLTVDQNLPFQQNLRESGIAVMVAVAHTNRVKELRPLMPRVLNVLRDVKAGEVIRVGVAGQQQGSADHLRKGDALRTKGPAAETARQFDSRVDRRRRELDSERAAG